MKLARLLAATLLALTFSITGSAQEKATDALDDDLFRVDTVDQGRARRIPSRDSSLYVVSAKAGIVNLADGDVSYKRADADWDLLIGGDELRSGDIVKTGATGRAEILLNPGSYLRIDEESEVTLKDASLDNLEIHIVKGSAIIEVSTGGKKEIFATMVTPHAKFLILEGGIYRFNVEASQSTAMVRKGRLVLPRDEAVQTARSDSVTIEEDGVKTSIHGTVVKSGKKIVVEGRSPVLASLSKNEEDNFDDWSKDRAKTLVAANGRISSRALNHTFISRFGSSLWVYNPFLGCYTYLPGWYGFRSPYGWGYNSYCNPYYRRYYPRNSGNSGGGYNGGSGGGSNGGGSVSGGGKGRNSGGGIGRPTVPRSGGSISIPGAGRSRGGNSGGGRGAAPTRPRNN